jgi:hypothetical protein
MHTISTRPPTSDEHQIIDQDASFHFGGLIFTALFFGAGAFGAGLVGEWLGSFFSNTVAKVGRYVGWGLGGGFVLLLLAACIGGELARRRLGRRDKADQQVQEIDVRNPRVIEIDPLNDHAPLLCFDMGDNMLLYLRGQWMLDIGIYGSDSPNGDENDDWFNGLDDPYGFPSTEFTVARLPHTGKVLRITIRGNYLPPEKKDRELNEECVSGFKESEIFPGQLDELAAAFEQEHQRRIVASTTS